MTHRKPLVDRFVLKYGRLPTEFDSDYLEMLRMSKYRILSRPDVNPAKCANCGSSKEDGRNYIDFGLQVDWYGAVFLCSLCLGDIAQNAGLFKAYEVEILKLEDTIEQHKSSVIKAEDLQATVLSTYEGVKDYFNNLPASGISHVPDSATNVVVVQEPSKPGINKAESGTDEKKSGTTKPTSSSGSKNLSSLTDLLSS